jgi:hypothetical protein
MPFVSIEHMQQHRPIFLCVLPQTAIQFCQINQDAWVILLQVPPPSRNYSALQTNEYFVSNAGHVLHLYLARNHCPKCRKNHINHKSPDNKPMHPSPPSDRFEMENHSGRSG